MQKKLINTFGSIVALVSIGFVGQQLLDNWNKVGDYSLDISSGFGLLLGAVIYCLACFFLSDAWLRILSALCAHALPALHMRHVYARSQIAKYIPGNVMQLVGRHVMIRQLGVGHKPLAVASIMEILGLLTASCTIALIGSALFGLWSNYLPRLGMSEVLIVIFLIILVFYVVFRVCLKYSPKSFDIINKRVLSAGFFAYLEYSLFFLLSGSVLVGLVYQFHSELDVLLIAALVATFAISWLAGFITPGAPSGIGIRETILVVTLDKILPGGHGVLIALLFRIITVAGDVLFYLLNYRNKRFDGAKKIPLG